MSQRVKGPAEGSEAALLLVTASVALLGFEELQGVEELEGVALLGFALLCVALKQAKLS